MLEVQGLSKYYGGLRAVSDCSFTVATGQIFGVIGPNGSGKTTLFQMIAGLIKPDGGQVLLDGRSTRGLRPNQLAHHGLAHTFQIPRVFGQLTVMENLRLATAMFTRQSKHAPSYHIEKFGLSGIEEVPARDLSHGQQKLLEFATVSAMEPQVLLLDEPTAGVNPRLIGRIEEIILALRDEGRTILIVEHTLRMVDAICDRVIVIDQGRKVTEGTPDELKSREDVRRAYYLI